MSYCSDLGYKVGDMFEVVDSDGSSYYTKGMIVRLEEDDNTNVPYFHYISGPTSRFTLDINNIAIPLDDVKKIESAVDVYTKEDIENAIDFLKWSAEDKHKVIRALETVVDPEYQTFMRLKNKFTNQFMG